MPRLLHGAGFPHHRAGAAFQCCAHVLALQPAPRSRSETVTRIADLWHANNQIVPLLGGGDLTTVDGSASFIGEWMNATGAANSLDGIANLKEIPSNRSSPAMPPPSEVPELNSHETQAAARHRSGR